MAITENVREFVRLVGLERVGFLTLTTSENLSYWSKAGWTEAQRRFHSFARRALPGIFGATARWAVVVEPQNRGAIHWHLLVECPGDIRTGFDFGAVASGDYRSAGPTLRRLWRDLRAACDAYSLGRHELLPVKSTTEAVADYVGKYLRKTAAIEGFNLRADGRRRPAHARCVRYSQGWTVASQSFAWLEKGRRWRAAVEHCAKAVGIPSLEGFAMRYGPRWAYHLAEYILAEWDRHVASQAAALPEWAKALLEERERPERFRFPYSVAVGASGEGRVAARLDETPTGPPWQD